MTEPSIRALANGPYLLEGDLPLEWKSPVVTEKGEPIAWLTGPAIDHTTPCILCRCGGSANKPFCDGTHARKGFDGTDSAEAVSRRQRAKAYDGEGIVVHDDRSICTHAGFCGTAATNVWKMVKDTADTHVRSQVVAMIERCPSGALSYALSPELDTDIEPDLRPAVGVTPDGPLWVTGGVTVEASSGDQLEVRNRMTLCRCGASANKPLCDGAHKKAGFSHRPATPTTGG